MRRFVGILVFSLALSVSAAYAQPTIVTLPNGGRVPCDHPLAIAAGLGCGAPGVVTTPPPAPQAPPPQAPSGGNGFDQPTPPHPFAVGHTYTRTSTGVHISIAGMGALQSSFGPIYVFFAQCLDQVQECAPLPDHIGPVVLVYPINTNRADYVDDNGQP